MISALKSILVEWIQGAEEPTPPPEISSQDRPHHIRRLHPRHGPLHGAVTFYLPRYGLITIANLSVGGLLLTVLHQDVSAFFSSTGEVTGYLSILNEKRRVTLLIVHSSDQFVNCRILHNDQSAILWMLPYLNMFRSGTQLKPARKQPQKVEYRDLSVTVGAAEVHIDNLSPYLSVVMSTSSPLVIPDTAAEQHSLGLALFVLFGFIECSLPQSMLVSAKSAIERVTCAFDQDHLVVEEAS